MTAQPKNLPKSLLILLLALGSVIAIGPLTIDIYLPAFNAIGDDLKSSERMIQMSMTSYFLGITFGQISYGPIIDRFGKKPPLFFGLMLFALASIGCYFATNIEQIIIFRFLQAIGACAGTIIPRAVVRDLFSPQDSGRIFSHLILVIGLAPILAPLIGNFFLEQFGWRAIFVFLFCFSIFCLLIAYFVIPETKGANKDERISTAFRKYWGILHDRQFIFSSLTGGLMIGGLFSYITASPAVYLDYFELSSRQYGWIFSINSIGFMIASQVNAQLLKKNLISVVLNKIILAPMIIGIMLITCPLNFWCITSLFFLFLCSCGMIFPNTTALALANHPKHSGSAAALLGTIQFGIASISSFLVGCFNDQSLIAAKLIVGICGIAACLTNKIGQSRKNS